MHVYKQLGSVSLSSPSVGVEDPVGASSHVGVIVGRVDVSSFETVGVVASQTVEDLTDE